MNAPTLIYTGLGSAAPALDPGTQYAIVALPAGTSATDLQIAEDVVNDVLPMVGQKVTPAEIAKVLGDAGVFAGAQATQAAAILAIVVPLIGTKINVFTGVSAGLEIYSLLAKTA